MVYINPPPPKVPPQPVIHTEKTGTKYLRLYDPAAYGDQPLTFRKNGPRSRFDHHEKKDGKAVDNKDRGIIYAADKLSGCVVEVFGDTRVIVVGTMEVALLETKRDIRLLDLRGDGAMKAGTVAAVCKDANRNIGQTWSQFFYNNSFVYGELDGLVFGNAHNDELAVALYERAQDALILLMSIPLKDDVIRKELQLIARDNGLIIEPY
jgi:hypothetical protein